jgi:Do/DeqQ family serine protease
MKKIIVLFFAAVFGGVVSVGIYKVSEREDALQTTQWPTTQNQQAQPQASFVGGYSAPQNVPDFTEAAEKTVHAVVHIKTQLRRRNSIYDDFFSEFFGRPYHQYSQPVIATGSGVIITDDGYIVTNNHVVQNAEHLEVTLNDKRSYEAKIVGADPATDLALIKIDEKNLPFLTYGNSDDVKVGEWVLAVGNPFNLTSTVTAGIVSAKARNINILGSNTAIESFIQTDAPINPGNSGGALVNTNGELIGINAAIASNTGSYTGYSFAIPVNIVKKVVNDFINYGEIQRAYIGVTIRDIDAEFAQEENLDDLEGVYVVSVVDNSSAEDADIRPADIILEIDGVKINSATRLIESVAQHNPGNRISVTVKRDGKILRKDVLLKNRQNNFDVVTAEDAEVFDLLGASFEIPSDETKSKLGINYGMQIVELRRGMLMNKGVREGFIITEIDKSPIRSLEDIKNIIKDKRGGVLIEGVYPSGQRAYYAIGL